MKKLVIFFGILLFIPSIFAAEWFVSPTGTSGGDGSMGNPWDVQTALYQPASVKPGDIIWMRGGTYTGYFLSYLNGNTTHPIIVRNYNNERAIFNQTGYTGLQVHGSNTWYWGLEFTALDPFDPTVSPYGMLYIYDAPRTKYINLIIHNAGHSGFGFWEDAVDSEVYGSIIYYNGIHHNNDHAIYTQNGVGTKKIIDNILFSNHDYGLHAYGSSDARLDNYIVEGNTAFQNGVLRGSYAMNYHIAGSGPVKNLTFRNNYDYYPPGNPSSADLRAGYYYGGAISTNATIANNYLMGGYYNVRLNRWEDMTFVNNTMYSENFNLYLNLTGVTTDGWTWGNNTWYASDYNSNRPLLVDGQSTAWSTFISNTGIGLNDTIYQPDAPTGTKVFVRPNQYESGRGHITIYNWDLANSVNVDVSDILNPGDTYQLINVQDYWSDRINGTYTGGTISIPMTGHTVETPSFNSSINTFPEFGVFVLQRTGSVSPQSSNGTLTSKSTTNTIIIDGVLSENVWSQASGVSFSNVLRSDNAVTVYSTWDANNLYFAYDVDDTKLEYDGAQFHQDDGAEIFIDPQNDKTINYDPNDRHVITVINDSSTVSSVSLKTVTNANGYIMEIAIPWSFLNITTPSNNTVLGLLLGNNDRDDGVNSQFDWLGIIETGSYYRANLWGNLTLTNLTQTGGSSPPTQTGTSGTSGGGGAGSGTSSTPSVTETQTVEQATPSGSIIFNGFDPELRVKQVEIKVNKDVQNVGLVISKYDSRPELIPIEKKGLVYRYLQLQTVNLGDSLDKVLITFFVDRDWVDGNELEPTEVSFFRYEEEPENWKELKTSYNDSDDNYYYYYYEAESDDFGYFAIGEQNKSLFENIKVGTPAFFLLLGGIIVFAIVVLVIIKFIFKKRNQAYDAGTYPLVNK